MESVMIQQADVLQAINKGEVDVQVATAKRYPRDLNAVLNKIATLATMDKETAEECFYVLRRGNSVIEGLSVRMAEIIASAWGNLRVATNIIANNGRTITAQAVCYDLETNVAISKTVDRRITDKQGCTYNEDMQVVTGNAASAIAFRNAVLAVVPKAMTKRVIAEVKRVALGQAIDLETSRQNLVLYFGKLGVTEQMLFDYFQISRRDEIDADMVFELRGLANAIREGTTTVQESFVKPVAERKQAEDARAKAEAVKARAKAAQEQSKKSEQETGEAISENE